MSADVDLAKAIMTRWSASAAVTSQVPGGLQTDMLTGDQDASRAFESKERPYAKLELAMDRDPEFSSSGDRIEFHKVTITVWGLGRESMGPVVSAIRTAMGEDAPSGWTVNNTKAVMAIYPMSGMGMVREEQTKDGERLIRATIPYAFWLHRSAM